MVDEAQKALEEAEALKKVFIIYLLLSPNITVSISHFYACQLSLITQPVKCWSSLHQGRSLLQIRGSILQQMFAL